MSDVTEIMTLIENGDPKRADELLPLMYDELRLLARQKLAHERPGQTLSPTALVHEAYLRLLKGRASWSWESRSHFYAAAAESMRRILIEQARRKKSQKRGGGDANRVELEPHLEVAAPSGVSPDELIALDEALQEFENIDPVRAQVVKLHYFSGLTLAETANALGISLATVKRHWVFARAWLYGKTK
jgi:RNA polymerase sigma factor (TIGR02999 family)